MGNKEKQQKGIRGESEIVLYSVPWVTVNMSCLPPPPSLMCHET